MRIVILYNSCWYVYLLRKNLIRALKNCGYHITVIAPRDEYTDRVVSLGVDFLHLNLSRCGTNPIRELCTLRDVVQKLRCSNPSVVLSYTVKCNLYAGLCQYIMKFHHLPNIAGLGQLFDSTGILRHLIHRLYRAGLHHSSKIFFQNSEDLEHFVKHRIIPPGLCTRLPGSGVDLQTFHPVTKKKTLDRRFLILGRLLPQKGFQTFLQVAKILKPRYGRLVSFWVLGSPDYERPESISLWHNIKKAHALGDIRYIPKSDNPAAIIQEADVIVLPSHYNEGVPRSLLEGLACAKPIITTDWKGCRDTVIENKNGILCQVQDPSSLEKAIEVYLQMDYKTLCEQGAYGRRLAEQKFDETSVTQAYLKAITDTGSEHRTSTERVIA